MEHRLREIEQSMEERWRKLEARVQSLDRRSGGGHRKPQPPAQDVALIPTAPGDPVMDAHVAALEACMEAALQSLFPHVDALLSELERRIAAVPSYSPVPPQQPHSLTQSSPLVDPLDASSSAAQYDVPPPSPKPSPRRSVFQDKSPFVQTEIEPHPVVFSTPIPSSNTTLQVPTDTSSPSDFADKEISVEQQAENTPSVLTMFLDPPLVPDTTTPIPLSSSTQTNLFPEPQIRAVSSPFATAHKSPSSNEDNILTSSSKILSSHNTSAITPKTIVSPTDNARLTSSSTRTQSSDVAELFLSTNVTDSTNQNTSSPFNKEQFVPKVDSTSLATPGCSTTAVTQHSTATSSPVTSSRMSVLNPSAFSKSQSSSAERSSLTAPAPTSSSSVHASKSSLNPFLPVLKEESTSPADFVSTKLSDPLHHFSMSSTISAQGLKTSTASSLSVLTKVTAVVHTTPSSSFQSAPQVKTVRIKPNTPPPVPPRQRSMIPPAPQGLSNTQVKPYTVSSQDKPSSYQQSLSTSLLHLSPQPAAVGNSSSELSTTNTTVSDLSHRAVADKQTSVRVTSLDSFHSPHSSPISRASPTTTTPTSSRWSLSTATVPPAPASTHLSSFRPSSQQILSTSNHKPIPRPTSASESSRIPHDHSSLSPDIHPLVAYTSSLVTTTTATTTATSRYTVANKPTVSSSIQPNTTALQSQIFSPVSRSRSSSIGEELSLPGEGIPLPEDGMTPLLQAAKYGETNDVLAALQKNPDIDAGDTFGQTALHWAAWRGHHEILSTLLKWGAEAKDVKNTHHLTPLHLAAATGHAQCVAFLVDAGVDVDSRSKLRRTPLHMAAIDGHDAVVQVLLAAGADPDAHDSHGRTPLSVASSHFIRELLLR